MEHKKEPRISKGDRTRRRILDAAVALMAEKGPDAVSMREISAKLRITKPVLYYYFRSKDELIRATFEEGTKHFRGMFGEISRPGLTLEQRLETIFSNHLGFIRRYPDMPKCALKIMSSPSGGVLAKLAREMKLRNRAALGSVLEKERLPKQGAENIRHLISAVIAYFMLEAKDSGVESLPPDLPRRLAKLICAGARHMKAAALLLLLLPLLGAAAPAGLSVDDAVAMAMKNNSSVANAERERLVYKEKIREYWGGVYPQLGAAASYTRNIEKQSLFFNGGRVDIGYNNAYSASLTLSQVLWAGGKVNTGIMLAGIYSDSSAERLRAQQNSVKKAVTQLYYSVLLSGAMADIQRETLALSRQHLDTINAQYAQGLASDLAVLRQRVEVSNNEPAVLQNLNYYEEGLLALKDLLGMEPDAGLSLSGNMDCPAEVPVSPDGLYEQALRGRPEYRLAALKKRTAAENVTLERAGHYPYLSAFASRQFQGQADGGFPGPEARSWSLAAGMNLSLPLFSGGAVSSRVRQAGLELDKADEDLRAAERAARISVKKAWLDLGEASRREASQAEAVAMARKALEATELRFRNGLAGQLDLSDATLALNRAQTLYSQARHDVCSADAELDWALGK